MSRKLTPEQRQERDLERLAEAKASRQRYIQEQMADWPPLTEEQIDVICNLLGPTVNPTRGPRPPSAYEIEQRRIQKERADALAEAKKLALSLTACDVCNLQPDAHEYQRVHGIFHEWMPGRAEKLMKRRIKP